MFIIQGEGRGHLTQALSMYDTLTNNGDEVVEILIGKNENLTLPVFFTEKIDCPVSTFNSTYFLFSPKNKKSMLGKSIILNIKKLPDYTKSIRFIKQRIKENNVDLIVNFYEPLTGLAYAFNRISTPYICVAHQYLLLHPEFVFPKKSKLELAALRFFTRMTSIKAKKLLALSFYEMPNTKKICVVPPLIRKEVLRKTATEGDYVLGYMLNAGFSEQVVNWHEKNRNTPLYFFWDKKGAEKEMRVDETLAFHQLDDKAFLDRMAGCRAYASTGGFESICEALYLQKPVMMIPAHIEQECNAFDAMRAGAGISCEEFNLSALLEFLPQYEPNIEFAGWVNKSSFMFLRELRTVETWNAASLLQEIRDRLRTLKSKLALIING
jgi:uncharacterized protein (TIGR00661 family)